MVPVSLVEKNFHSYLKWPFENDQSQTVHQDLLAGILITWL